MALSPDHELSANRGRPETVGSDGWTAVVMAGERPGGDPLAAQMQVPLKALVRIHGKTLLDHVLSSLLDVDRIKRVVVLGQDLETLALAIPQFLEGGERVSLVRSGSGIANSIASVAGTPDAPWPVLVTTADNALLTPERVERFLDAAGGTDIALGVGKRTIVERAFPETRRTWLKFIDGHYSGANLFALSSPRCLGALRKWSEIEQDRKKGWKLVASFGPVLLLRALTRTITLAAALESASRQLGCTAKPVVLDAEAPIDVDKTADIELVERILAARQPTGITQGGDTTHSGRLATH